MISERLIIIVASLVITKFAQAWLAHCLGDPTPKMSGRLSLNPLAHIDIFTTLLLPLMVLLMSQGLIVLGYTKPLTINPYHLKNMRSSMRLLGILPSLVHIGIALCLLPLLGLTMSFLHELLLFGIWSNVMLALIMLIPLPPLEGAKIAASFLPGRMSRDYLNRSPYGFFLIGIFFFSGALPLGARTATYFIVTHVLGISVAI